MKKLMIIILGTSIILMLSACGVKENKGETESWNQVETEVIDNKKENLKTDLTGDKEQEDKSLVLFHPK